MVNILLRRLPKGNDGIIDAMIDQNVMKPMLKAIWRETSSNYSRQYVREEISIMIGNYWSSY